jgi:pimeloyl-ACP methyl ester carboxylesterase
MQATRVFIHGLESSGRGTKGTYFGEQYPDMIIEDYLGSFRERMEKLEEILTGKSNLIIVGSSFGGLMAAVYACLHEETVDRLILLAPALHLDFYRPYRDKKLHTPVTIYHGLQDDVVPLNKVRDIAEKLFVNRKFHAVDDDHPLHKTFPALDWDSLLNYMH